MENKNKQLEFVFSDETYQLTGVAVSRSGRLFTCYPLWQGPHRYSLVEIVNGEARPYPNEEMNNWKEGDDGMQKWVCVQAVYIDDQDAMWVVDPASPQMKNVYQDCHKLVKIDLRTNSIEQTYFFAGIASEKSYLNDVRLIRTKDLPTSPIPMKAAS